MSAGLQNKRLEVIANDESWMSGGGRFRRDRKRISAIGVLNVSRKYSTFKLNGHVLNSHQNLCLA